MRESARNCAATPRTYIASESESTSLPAGSTFEGIASRIMSMILITLASASSPATFTNMPRSCAVRESLSIPAWRTAECDSVSAWTAGYTGTLTNIPSEYFTPAVSSALNTSLKPRSAGNAAPARSSATLTSNIDLTVSPPGTVTLRFITESGLTPAASNAL